MKDLDALALAMPEVTRDLGDDGRPTYRVKGKMFACHRTQRPDAVDAQGRRLDDVLVFRVGDLETKEALVADPSSPYFTTPHFDGYPAVLVRIPHLRRVGRRELFELVADAWLTRAPKALAKSWLADRGL